MSDTTREASVRNHLVPTPHGRVHVTDRPGDDPAFVLMHGFPDDSRIYERLAPLLAPRRVVTFDFVGYGRSERPDASAFERGQHEYELTAVVDGLELENISLLGHDSSGPLAIDHAVNAPERVGHLILLNTYYGHAPALRFPEMIRLFADHNFAPLVDAMIDDTNQRLWLLWHTARRWGMDPADPSGIGAASIVPQFFGDADTPDALAAIRAWTGDLFAELDRHDQRIGEGRLAVLETPVTLLFGARDEYLSPDIARHLAGLFAKADMDVIEDASHWPQWDQPEIVSTSLKDRESHMSSSAD